MGGGGREYLSSGVHRKGIRNQQAQPAFSNRSIAWVGEYPSVLMTFEE